MNLKTLGVAALALATTSTLAFAQARDTIQVAGSSTVLPFASIVAEEFGNAFPAFNTPVVGSGGTGGGFRQFCEGVGPNTIDIANASRPISAAEIATCNTNGVNQILEVQFGFDGIVFATSTSQGDFALTPLHVFKALAAQVPVDGVWVANPYTNWNQIDPALPDQAITLVIPASNHGTREVFQTRVIDAGCHEVGGAEAQCTTFRTDGRVVEISGDYTETLARLQSAPAAVGVFGLSFYEENRDTLKVASVSGIVPTLETVADGTYPVSRPLYFYVKGEHIGVIPGIAEFVTYFLSDEMAGPGGFLQDAGLIPEPDDVRAAALAGFEARTVVAPR
ncbi:MAG: substrate-binding domain-containing protein [Bauldia sp.]|nr:substrate-binding domain-containing protein [Bauldia sp.]